MSKHDETLISTIAEPVLNNIGRDMTYPNVVRAVNRQNRFQTLGRVDGFDQDILVEKPPRERPSAW